MTEHTIPQAQTTEPMGKAASWAVRYSRFADRRRLPLTIAWMILLVLAGIAAAPLTRTLNTEGWDVGGSSALAVKNDLAQGFTGRADTTVVLVVRGKPNTPPADLIADAHQAYAATRKDPRLKVVDGLGFATLPPPANSAYVGSDHRTTLTSVGLKLSDTDATVVLPKAQSDLQQQFGPRGVDVYLLSNEAFQADTNYAVVASLIRGELVAMPITALVLLLIFRSVAAAVIAMAVPVSGILLTLGVFGPLSTVTDLSIFLENSVLMFGLAVGLDYSLLMIRRFKEGMALGLSTPEAVERTLATAGHTVVASGVTIIVAAFPLFIVRLTTIVSLAAGAAMAVAITMLVAVLLLPVVLHIAGPRINAGRIPIPAMFPNVETANDDELTHHRWYQLALRVMRRPVVYLLAAVIALVVLAIPAMHLKLFAPDFDILPSSSQVRQGFSHVADAFGPGATSPVQVVITKSGNQFDATDDTPVRHLIADLSVMPGVRAVNSAMPVLQQISPSQPFAALHPAVRDRLDPATQSVILHSVSDDCTKLVIEVLSTRALNDDLTASLVGQVRLRAANMAAPLHAEVGGDTARAIDITEEIRQALPWVFALSLLAVYLVLLVTFRSVFVPLKAIAVNVLSVGATFGVMVAVFQNGDGTSLLHLDKTGYLVAFVPLLVIAMIVGLSTDYEVFLLSRIKEEYIRCGDNETAVARGLARTAPLITGAAVLMVVVFAAFGLTGIVPIEQIGIGLAVAVTLDATLVRIVIVPAVMRLLGKRNWWMPGRPDPAERLAAASDVV